VRLARPAPQPFRFFHKRFQDERIRLSADRARRGIATFILPVLEDANSIQIALMQVMRLLVSQQIDHKTASLLLYALQTASTNLRLTNFKPFTHEVILDPRDVANTPLDSHIWDDEDFEEEEDEEQTAADRAIEALETARKKKEEEAKWMRWAEARYPKPNQPVAPSAAITATGSAALTPASPPKKRPSKEEIRQTISEQIRKQLLPGFPSSGSSSSSG